MDKQIISIDSPTDFIVGKYVSSDELKQYMNAPYKIKAGVFILCMEGRIRTSINQSEYTATRLHVTTLIPNSYLQIHEMSEDILVYFVAFSSDFMGYVNFVRSTMNCLSYRSHRKCRIFLPAFMISSSSMLYIPIS